MGRHWRRFARAKKELAELLFAYSAHVRRVSATYRPRRRLTFTVSGWPAGGRLPDPDNVLKALLDGLKTARLIVDDSTTWVEWEMPVIVRAGKGEQWGTRITIEDVS